MQDTLKFCLPHWKGHGPTKIFLTARKTRGQARAGYNHTNRILVPFLYKKAIGREDSYTGSIRELNFFLFSVKVANKLDRQTVCVPFLKKKKKGRRKQQQLYCHCHIQVPSWC